MPRRHKCLLAMTIPVSMQQRLQLLPMTILVSTQQHLLTMTFNVPRNKL
ncbi:MULTISPECIES: hypothetical protein [unclassified Rickettsia]